MNFEHLDPKIASSREAQAKLLKSWGYDGAIYLGPLGGVKEAFRALDAEGWKCSPRRCSLYDIPVDPGEICPANLKEAIPQLKGRKTLLLIQFQSKAYPGRHLRGMRGRSSWGANWPTSPAATAFGW